VPRSPPGGRGASHSGHLLLEDPEAQNDPEEERMPAAIRTVLTRAACLLPVIAICSTPSLVAQEEQPNFLPSSMIPNYDRIRIGQNEGLEGSAFVARTGDASSNWYNPAGLASSDGTALNASANAYEYTSITTEGLDTKFGSGRFRSVGTFFGGVIGSPILKGRTVRLGFSLTKPVVWSPGAITSADEFDLPGTGEETITVSSKVSMSTSVPAINAGFRLSDDLRLGAGTSMSITDMSTVQQFTDRLLTPSFESRALRSLILDGNIWQLQFTGSAQWDITDAIAVGAMVTSPGLQLSGSGLAEYQDVTGVPAGSVDILFRDTTASFEYKLPFRVVGGVAVSFGRFEVEADVRYYGSVEEYNLIDSELPVRVVVSDASGTPSLSEQPFEPLIEKTQAVTNVAIGGNYSISESFRLHVGFFTDNSPVANPATSLFRTVDLMGLSGGVSFGGRLSGSLGFSSSWGTTDERFIGPTLGGQTGASTVGITTFNLHYSISYAF
jgi:hypothetical protein